MNIVFANSAWYGRPVTTRTAIAMRRICAGEGVDDVEVLAVEVRDDLLAQALEVLLGDLLVDARPTRCGSSDPGSSHDELVLRRAAGEAAGVDDERPALGEPALVALERVRVQERRRRVPVDGAARAQPVVGEADRSA